MGRRGALGALILASLALAPAAQARPLVTLHQTGGFAGVDERLVVKESRSATFTDRDGSDRFTVPRDRMRRLRSALDGWRRLEPNYPARPVTPDGFHYAVTHAGHTVRTADGAERPRKLDRVLAILQRIASRR
jgi:hypothetical protein